MSQTNNTKKYWRAYRTPTYYSYSKMRERCYNPNHTSYPKYGARGIKVCERWNGNFRNFLADMGERPEGMTLDRVDGEKDYSPENCRWADKYIQGHNRRINKNNTTGYRGVFLINTKYSARIRFHGELIQIGVFDTALKAAIAYNNKAKELYGDYANSNSI
jgi:hypothetical protein